VRCLAGKGDTNIPSAKQDLAHASPEELVGDIIAKERRILDLLTEIKAILATEPA
jgi:hypothetical protein